MMQIHKDNLLTLANYLDALPVDYAKFDMGAFFRLGSWCGLRIPPVEERPCYTAACAVGHGPFAGMPTIGDEAWDTYAERVFGVNASTDEDDDLGFEWMFGSSWTDFDDTPRGAAARIRYFLHHGVAPEDFQYGRSVQQIEIYSSFLKVD